MFDLSARPCNIVQYLLSTGVPKWLTVTLMHDIENA